MGGLINNRRLEADPLLRQVFRPLSVVFHVFKVNWFPCIKVAISHCYHRFDNALDEGEWFTLGSNIHDSRGSS